MTDREKILIALREKPLKAFENHEACEHKASGLPIALLKMRDGGAVKFDIHKGHWLDVVQGVSENKRFIANAGDSDQKVLTTQ